MEKTYMIGLINPKLITQYPKMSATARSWISKAVNLGYEKYYIDFLNRTLSLLKKKKQIDILNRICDSDESKFEEAISEIIFAALFKNLNWPFEKDPDLYGKKPDFKVIFDKELKPFFICEVSVVRHNQPHERKILNSETGDITIKKKTGDVIVKKLPKVTEPINQAHRIGMKVKEKYDKYKEILTAEKIPFIVGLCISDFENIFYLEDQIDVALFGDLKLNFGNGELRFDPSLVTTQHDQVQRGIFAFEENKTLTAVLVIFQEFCWPKVKFRCVVYVNPLGELANIDKNPFLLADLPVIGLLDKDDKIKSCEPKEIVFY